MGGPSNRWRGQAVVFHLVSGRTIGGTLWAERSGMIEVRGAVEVQGQHTTPLDGSVVIPSRAVDYYQVGVELPHQAVRAVA